MLAIAWTAELLPRSSRPALLWPALQRVSNGIDPARSETLYFPRAGKREAPKRSSGQYRLCGDRHRAARTRWCRLWLHRLVLAHRTPHTHYKKQAAKARAKRSLSWRMACYSGGCHRKTSKPRRKRRRLGQAEAGKGIKGSEATRWSSRTAPPPRGGRSRTRPASSSRRASCARSTSSTWCVARSDDAAEAPV